MQSKETSYSDLPKTLIDDLTDIKNTNDPTGVKSLLQKIISAKSSEVEVKLAYRKLEKLVTDQKLIEQLKAEQAKPTEKQQNDDKQQKVSNYDLFSSTLTPALFAKFKAREEIRKKKKATLILTMRSGFPTRTGNQGKL